MEKKEIVIKYLRTDLMIADILTKSLSKVKHNRFVSMLQLVLC